MRTYSSNQKSINAGKYNKRIQIVELNTAKDEDGYPIQSENIVMECYANVRNYSGSTLFKQDSDFESAYTNFTIRYTKRVKSGLYVKFRGEFYRIDYVHNINEEDIELELQAQKQMHG